METSGASGIRKAVKDYGNNTLDNIASIELHYKKRQYSDISVDVINAPIKSYWEFVLYNINDVMLQLGLERKTEDIQSLFEQSYEGGTRISKILKQSIYLKNVYTIDYYNMGLIIGNNCNEDYGNGSGRDDYDNIKLIGALVGDPILNYPNGEMIFGKPSRYVYSLLCDKDAKSMYPNINILYGIAPERQYGRLIIEKKIRDDEDPTNDPRFMRGGKFASDLCTYDTNQLGVNWFGLHSITDYLLEMEQKKNNKFSDRIIIQSRSNK